MFNKVITVLTLLMVAILSGCVTSSHMTAVDSTPDKLKPQPGKSLLVFLRPSSYGGSIQSTLYDGDEYIGTISAKTKVAYQANPGQHTFMIVGESADFMQATLDEGKTYYTVIAPRMGVWKARFSLRPQNGQIPAEDIKKWMDATRLVEIGPEGKAWATENAASVMQKKNKYWPKWQSKPAASKQTLHSSSGL
ncbi:MAG TPA: hypothetical protein EYH06_04890 [Chromatiales bacterium]|nr:hypothetical protein [Thiotrichales bacterium]HIP67913.1 hypothetical protein [Chromatiales bacterium]